MGLPNTQAHHVVQNAIYGEIVAKRDGMTISVEGNVFRDSGSLHNRMHALSDAELDTFRASGTIPTNAEYAAISARGLQSVGFHEAVIEYVMDQVIANNGNVACSLTCQFPGCPEKCILDRKRLQQKRSCTMSLYYNSLQESEQDRRDAARYAGKTKNDRRGKKESDLPYVKGIV